MNARQTRPLAVLIDEELERFCALVRQAPYFIGIFDPGLTPVFVNDAGRRMVGLAPDADVSAIAIPDFFHPDDRPRIRDIALPTVLSDGRWEGECRFRHFEGGDSYPVRWRAFALRGEGGELIGGATITTDIRERKAAEERLRRSEARLALAVELAGLAPFEWDPRTGALNWDAKLKLMWGLPPDAPVDPGVWLAGVHPEDRERVGAALAACSDPAGDGTYQVDYRVIGIEDGIERWVRTHGQAFFEDGWPAGFIGAALDITDQKRAERALHAILERQAVLVAELQHRTRNLLGVVRSVANQTAQSSRSIAEFTDRLNARLAALGRVQGLLSRADEEQVGIGEILRLELDALGAGAAASRISIRGPDVPLRRDAVQIVALAAHELATNAQKYGALARDSGHLTVRWTVRPDVEGERLQLEWVENGVAPLPGDEPPGDRRGFGRHLIEKALPFTLGAETRYELGAKGLRCTISIPLC